MITAKINAQLRCDEPGCTAVLETQMSITVNPQSINFNAVEIPQDWVVVPTLGFGGHRHLCPEHKRK